MKSISTIDRAPLNFLHWRIIILVLMGFTLFGCSDNQNSGNHLTFWSSNNPQEMEFTRNKILNWNKERPENQIQFQPVPEGQSSEEVILAAVVAGTTPDIYANMWQGDVEDYARAGKLVPLDTIPGFLEFISERTNPEVLKEITSRDGHIYQVPWKMNPIMLMYNSGIFKKYGVEDISTYSRFLQSGEKVVQDFDNDGYTDLFFGVSEVNPIWWQRFFNFIPLYYAASGGAPLVENGKAAFDNEHGVEVFRFLRDIYKNGLFPVEQRKGQSDPFVSERVALRITGPWAIEHVNLFKKEGFEYDFMPMPIPDGSTNDPYTYCDPKNIVLFSTCKNPQEAWSFVRTMITPEADLEFLETSKQFPRRGDLLTNPLFVTFFEQHPELIPFANQSQWVKGIDSSPYMKEVLDLISQEYEACILFDRKSPEEAINDAAKAVNLLFLEY